MENRSTVIWGKIKKGVFIVAEAGKNFIQTKTERPVAEYLKNAKRLVDEAVSSGADAIKFQAHHVHDEQLKVNVTSPHFKGSDRYAWVLRNTEATPLKGFWKPLKEYCDKRGIIFFSTPMSRGAAQILEEVGVNLWKVGSGDILDFALLDYLRASGQPIILSSGMSTFNETKQAIGFLREQNDRVALLHCVSRYPCPPEDLNLKTIEFYRERLGIPIGFSDHSLSTASGAAAVALGATIIEKHFSLSRKFWGSDHKVSLTPPEFALLVKGIREIQDNYARREQVLKGKIARKAMGDKAKILQEEEAVFRPIFRKSLRAGQDLPAGTLIQPEMVYAMRPQKYAAGLPSERYQSVVGRRLRRQLRKYEPITKEVLV